MSSACLSGVSRAKIILGIPEFDPTVWYPLGRVVGGTYAGLMVMSGVIYNVLHALNLLVDIQNIRVFLAPGLSALTT